MFEEKFLKHRETPIALYGLGIQTKHLLDKAKDYNIVGIVANDRIGERVYGNEVLAIKEIEDKAKIIIIVAQTKSVKLIYKRIKHVEKKGIAIYNISGEKMSDDAENRYESMNNPYWESTYAQLKKEIDRHDIISFDFFDTLVMRKVLMPGQIWDVMARELDAMEITHDCDFKTERMKAEQQLREQGVLPAIEEIYKVLGTNIGLNEQWSQWLMNKEFEIEKKYVVRRKCLVDAVEYARIQGKRIYVIADTHLSSDQIHKLLLQCSITSIDTSVIFVSSDLKKSKSDGSLYDLFVKEAGSGNKLHIGSNRHTDIEIPALLGIDTYFVMSAYEMFKESTAGNVINEARNINDYVVLGLFAAQAFNDPFSLSLSKGKLDIKSMYDLGYYCFAPITLEFAAWMFNTLKDNADSVLLFSSRDGYLLYNIYQNFRLENEHLNLPEAVYFYTSRRALTVAGIRTEEDIKAIVESVFSLSIGNLGEVLEQRLGVCFAKDTILNRALIAVTGDEDKTRVVARVLEYKESILKNSSIERMNFLNYIQSNSLYSYKKIFLFDLYTKGTSLIKLTQLMNREIELICYSLKDFPNDLISTRENIKSLYDPNQSNSNYWFEKAYQLFEVIYSSAEGQLERFDDQLQPQFVPLSEYNYPYIKEAQAGIADFLNQLVSVDASWFSRSINLTMADSLSRLMTAKYSIISSDIHLGFTYYDSFASEKTTNIWDDII
ncbi:hypothetical protein [Paenibacillus typhae]|uniref:hypothetical protein n=1 Tax=Paenibacillus typhae TaxID=1174501 RepID=UPI001C8ED4C7|nr:hypothetical protein [Paenibacillus typhae]